MVATNLICECLLQCESPHASLSLREEYMPDFECANTNTAETRNLDNFYSLQVSGLRFQTVRACCSRRLPASYVASATSKKRC